MRVVKIFILINLIFALNLRAEEVVWTPELKEEVKKVIGQLIERKVAGDVALELEKLKFTQSEIEEVLLSPEMDRFARSVRNKPETIAGIDQFIQRWNVENTQTEQLQEEAVTKRISDNAAIKEYALNVAKSRGNLNKRPSSSPLQRFWDWLKSELFEG